MNTLTEALLVEVCTAKRESSYLENRDAKYMIRNYGNSELEMNSNTNIIKLSLIFNRINCTSSPMP